MKHKTSELTGALLDAAVAKATGNEIAIRCDGIAVRDLDAGPVAWMATFRPSVNWKHGGPIIEREGIATWRGMVGWHAIHPHYFKTGYDGRHEYIDVESGDCWDGPTSLIAAMRCYVALKFGEEVEL